MYHAVCREYIPNGEKLSDDQVDEASTIHSTHSVLTTDELDSTPRLGRL